MVVVLPLGGSLCGEAGERLGQGAAALTACRLQREGGNFTGLGDPGRAYAATGLVCSCYCVRSGTVIDGGGGVLPHADGAAALVLAPLLH